MGPADELLAMAGSDPRRTLSEGDAYLETLGPGDHYERAVALRALSLAARHTSQITDSIVYAQRSSDAAREGGLERIALLAQLTETGSLAISGDLDGALTTIESVLAEVEDGEMRAEFEYQRAAVLGNMGHLVDAIAGFEMVLPVYEKLGDSRSLMMTLNQLGRLQTEVGDLTSAEQSLDRSLAIARSDSEMTAVHGILHNLGLLAAYRGDIPEALQKLYESDELYMEISGATAPQHVARGEVLISVGLYDEALETAQSIARDRAMRDDREHEVQALMVAARAALLAERHREAIELADLSQTVVGEAGQVPILLEARAIAIEARLGLEGSSRQLLGDALLVAADMESEGMSVSAMGVKSLGARISEDLGDDEVTIRLLEEVAKGSAGPVELRLEGPLARARLAAIRGDRSRALRSVRSGLAMIDRFQEALGSTELRLGIERRGKELADVGLRLGVEAGRPRQVLEWLDRTRARALRLRPVTPIEDELVGAMLTDMRRLSAELRKPSRRDDVELLRRRRELERQILATRRTRRGAGSDGAGIDTRGLIEELGSVTLYEIGAVDDRLFAVRVSDGRARMVSLGEPGRLQSELEHLRFTMRRAALRGRSVEASVLDELADQLFGETDFGDSDVLIVPPPQLMAVPWPALPPLRGRAVHVSPSAEMWWRAGRSGRDDSGSVVVTGGPDLEMAEEEVRRVGAIHAKSIELPPGATVEAVSRAIDGADIAHIACHATFQHENPMFSSLRLGDGDLNVYDIERLEQPPSLVVLSACDSGYTEARAGSELAGLTSALLSMGTRTVVASVGLVPDSPATSDLMVDFHKGLVAGLEPARALAAAQAAAWDDPDRFVSAASFICVGA